jgi:hypothetical protein
MATCDPLPLVQVLRDEYIALRPDWERPLVAAGDDLRKLLATVHRLQEGDPLVALCFSGGGIRSATFNLGVLQGLAERGVLRLFDYLSSVSGGGYVSSWFVGWLKRKQLERQNVNPSEDARTTRDAAFAAVTAELKGPQPDPSQPEPTPIRHLRAYGNYLTPRLGLLSADTWTTGVIVVRNLILNWLVLIPILAAVLTLPLLAIATWDVPVDPAMGFRWALILGGSGCVLMTALRGNVPDTPDSPSPYRWLAPAALLLLLAGTTALIVSVHHREALPTDFRSAFRLAAAWALYMPLVAFWLSLVVQRAAFMPPRAAIMDTGAVFVAGVVETAIYAGLIVHVVPSLGQSGIALFAVVAPALVLVPFLLGKTLFVAVASYAEQLLRSGLRRDSEYGDAQREWWARWSAWILIVLLGWTGASALVYFGPGLLENGWARLTALGGGPVLGWVISHVGKSAATPGRKDDEHTTPWKQYLVAWGVPLFCVLLLAGIAWGSQALLAMAAGIDASPLRAGPALVAGTAAGLFAFGVAAALFVNVNRFSLQAMYRNRLVRAYLGASNIGRRPNFFTGFDPTDNLRLHELRDVRPMPVVNMALNLVNGGNLAWQERKAESFTATPLHCGSAEVAYRRTENYGGPWGLSLGTAVATSGAAANPNMGYNSSPAVGFVMTLFNARLGTWLGNPAHRRYASPGPRLSSWYYLLAEAFGWTDDRRWYVNLSDGGHFDNLGLYEMVRRRCRFIVVSDAGQDADFNFDDLGSAIRKIRIDLGISIEFDKGIHIQPKTSPAEQRLFYCAVGTVNYADVDGTVQPGTILYLKPTLCQNEPYDVYNYAKASRDFPHETTADQWFSETQFESYRTLGKTTVLTVLNLTGSQPIATLADISAAVDRHLRPPAPASAPPDGDTPMDRLVYLLWQNLREFPPPPSNGGS